MDDRFLKPKNALVVPASALWMVMLTVFMDTMGDSVLTPMLAPYAKQQFNATDTQVGYLFSCPCVAAFSCASLIATLTNRIGRRPVFILALFGPAAAALCQALASNYNFLLAGRTFGGVWTVTISTAKVYINEVTSWDTTGNDRSDWFGKLALSQNVARLFGPALGGALAHYGLNVPSFVTFTVLLVGAAFAYVYLVESPAFVEISESKLIKPPASKGHAMGRMYAYCCASMFTNSCVKLSDSILALFLIDKYNLSTIDIGFIYLCAAVGTIFATRLVRPLNQRLGAYRGAALASLVQAFSVVLLPLFPVLAVDASPAWLRHLYFCSTVFCFVLTNASCEIANALQGAISGEFENQPFVQSRGFQFRQAAKIFVPLLGTRLIGVNLMYPWFLGGALAAASAPICWWLRPPPRMPLKQPTVYGPEWADEVLSEQDVLELGNFMVGLFRRKHLRWSRERHNVERLLEHCVPEMPIDSRDSYYEALSRHLE